MNELVPIAGFNGIAAGCKATLKLPTDRLYKTLIIDATFGGSRDQADVEKYVTKIMLSSCGQTLRQFTAERLNYMNRHNGGERYGYNGYLIIHFSQPWRATVQAEDMDALGTLGMTDLTLDVDLADDAPAPMLKVIAVVNWNNRAPGKILKQIEGSIIPAQAGDVDITTLRKGPAYSRIHFFSPLVTKVEVGALGRIFVRYDKLLNHQLGILYGIVHEDDVFSVDFDYTQQVSDAMPTGTSDGKGGFTPFQDLNYKVTVSAGGVIPFITEIREDFFR